jgi:glycosyltransferase involved in cell wall biosynthesis
MTFPSLTGRRVALVLATSTGGTGRHVCVLCAGLTAAGARVRVTGPRATDATFGFADTGARFTPVELGTSRRPLGYPAAVVRLQALLAAAEIVHSHGLRAGAVAALAAPRHVPLVATWHNAVLAHGPSRLLSAPMERLVARRAQVNLCVSPDLEQRVAAVGGRKVRLAPVSAPPLPPPTRPRAVVRAALGAGDRPLVLTVARLHEQKGYPTLIAAAARLAHRRPPPLFVAAGDGPLAGSLAGQIATTTAPVRLLGHRADVADLLAACDLVVLPSVWEGSPLAAQEALRAGVPLVATRVGGIDSLVGTGALLIPPGDATALADAIGQVLDSPTLAASLADRAKAAARLLPTDESVVDQVMAIYYELLRAH